MLSGIPRGQRAADGPDAIGLARGAERSRDRPAQTPGEPARRLHLRAAHPWRRRSGRRQGALPASGPEERRAERQREEGGCHERAPAQEGMPEHALVVSPSIRHAAHPQRRLQRAHVAAPSFRSPSACTATAKQVILHRPLGRWAHPKTGRGLGTLANTRTAAVLWLGPRGRRPAHELPTRRRSRLAGDEGSKSG